MGKKNSIYLLSCILLVIVIYPLSAQGQLPVVSNKGSTVTVPKVTGMLQKDAEATIAKAGLEVANIIERETPFPAGKVVRQKPMPDTKVEKGSGVVLVVSKAKEQLQLKTPVAPSGMTQPEETAEKLTKGKTAPLPGDKELLNSPIPEKQILPKKSAINTAALKMTGMRIASQTISTGPLVMTGMRVASQTIITAPLQMTGMRVNSITINAAPLKMTGMRP
ncbi:MAG: PASTA domain-containing protein [Deltaproteobacteria bacterium]